MKKILFVYGFGGSPESQLCQLLRETLPADAYQVLCPVYPQEDLYATRRFLQEFIQKEQIDLVVGTSLGGFVTLSLDTALPRVVINPGMMPTVELSRLQPRADHPDDKPASTAMLASYGAFEEGVNRGAYHQGAKVIGLFAEHDELLGVRYAKPFKTYYDNVRMIPGGHHGCKDAAPAILQAVQDAMKPILYVDMDNVLADFEGYADTLPEDVRQEYEGRLDEMPGIFARFPVVDGAKEALEVLQQRYELYILSTSPWNNPTALQDKNNWIKQHFGEMFHKHVIFTHQKNLCIRQDAWLVDDRPNHGAYQFGDHWLHFGRDGKYKSWQEVCDYLMNLR